MDDWNDGWMTEEESDEYVRRAIGRQNLTDEEKAKFQEAMNALQARPRPGKIHVITSSGCTPDYENIVYGTMDWVKPEPENDWRDEGTEANKRVEKLLTLVGVLNAATFSLAAGSSAATGAATIYHAPNHANDWLFAIALGIAVVGGAANAAAYLAMKKIRAITEDA